MASSRTLGPGSLTNPPTPPPTRHQSPPPTSENTPSVGTRLVAYFLARALSELGELVVVKREWGEKLRRRLAQDEVGLSRAFLGVGALELAVGIVVGRAVGERQGSHVVAVPAVEGGEVRVPSLARLRVTREWGPRAPRRNVRQGRQVREAAREALVLPVLAGAVGLVERAHVEHALVCRVQSSDGAPGRHPDKVVE
eukprot:scaffold12204_cov61-Phaeocystis_antarctica.AAC.14